MGFDPFLKRANPGLLAGVKVLPIRRDVDAAPAGSSDHTSSFTARIWRPRYMPVFRST